MEKIEKIVFWDWNGTILDDIPICYKSTVKIFQHFGVEPPKISEYLNGMQNGDYLEIYRRRGINASRDELNDIYGPAYEKLVHRAELFFEAKETLHYLHAREDIKLVLITLQKENLVMPLLIKFGIKDVFYERIFHALNKEEVIRHIAGKNGIDTEKCFFIGDSPSDMRHAKVAGTKSIALLSSYVSLHLLTDSDYLITSLWEVIGLIDR